MSVSGLEGRKAKQQRTRNLRVVTMLEKSHNAVGN